MRAEAIGQEPRKPYVVVVGGHAENTSISLFFKKRPDVSFNRGRNKNIDLVCIRDTEKNDSNMIKLLYYK